ncbi:hypothetical protein B23_1446 [Geobacillus thermoleovorans B23]|nr:hypothetical protein B23_1446 [Geobacillus thermoleovorans B23]
MNEAVVAQPTAARMICGKRLAFSEKYDMISL